MNHTLVEKFEMNMLLNASCIHCWLEDQGESAKGGFLKKP